MAFNYYENKTQADARRLQLNHELNRDALADSIQRAQANQGSLYSPILAKAGEVLESLGQQLQTRYGEASKAPLAPMQPLPTK